MSNYYSLHFPLPNENGRTCEEVKVVPYYPEYDDNWITLCEWVKPENGELTPIKG